MEILEHFGVYGVCIRDNKLLCIRKQNGPYNARYDLPGGSRNVSESLLDILKREFSEETTYEISSIKGNALFDVFVKTSEYTCVHHIFGIYFVELKKNYTIDQIRHYISLDEINDSLGEEWVPIDELTEQNSSPLILKVLSTEDIYNGVSMISWTRFGRIISNQRRSPYVTKV